MAGLTTDSTKWAGANIANLDAVLSTTVSNAVEDIRKKQFIAPGTYAEWDENADGDQNFPLDFFPSPTGTFTMELTYTTNGSAGCVVRFEPLWEDANNCIFVVQYDSHIPGPRVVKRVASSNTDLINAGNTSDTSSHLIEMTRDAMGNYELFEDTVSEGTATDDYTPTATQTHLFLDDQGGNSVIRMTKLSWEGFV